MSESKLNDLFTGEICYEYEPLSECFKFSIQDDKGVILGAWHEGIADFACTAIESYYTNQDLITKQAEQIKMLRKALVACKVNLSYSDDTFAGGYIELANKALEATKPVEE